MLSFKVTLRKMFWKLLGLLLVGNQLYIQTNGPSTHCSEYARFSKPIMFLDILLLSVVKRDTVLTQEKGLRAMVAEDCNCGVA